jgi:hypothetical protein
LKNFPSVAEEAIQIYKEFSSPIIKEVSIISIGQLLVISLLEKNMI